MNVNRSKTTRSSHRGGFTMIECVIAASILIVAMGTVTTMAFRLSRVWIDVNHQRIAMNELTNTLEWLSEIPGDEIDDAIAGLKPSPYATASLHEPELSGRRISDELGDRVVLTMNWQSAHPIRPVELVGWIDPVEDEQ